VTRRTKAIKLQKRQTVPRPPGRVMGSFTTMHSEGSAERLTTFQARAYDHLCTFPSGRRIHEGGDRRP
jgi:hypothetical protein